MSGLVGQVGNLPGQITNLPHDIKNLSLNNSSRNVCDAATSFRELLAPGYFFATQLYRFPSTLSRTD